MRILSADLTSFTSSLAFVQDGRVLEELEWPTTPGRHQDYFTRLREGLARQGWQPADLDLLVTGCGPGNFSGMRTGQAAFEALALPRGIPVRAVSSGRAIAARLFREQPGLDRVAVVGDARRDSLWCGRFTREATSPVPAIVPYEKLALTEAARLLTDCPLVASPDASRLSPRLSLPWHPRDLAPSAAELARIALEECNASLKGESVEPIYLHPAVREAAAP